MHDSIESPTLTEASPSADDRSVEEWRAEFPALAQKINGQPLVYLDTAATSLRPRAVIDAMSRFYETDNANPSGTLHTLARRANDQYERARATVAGFIGASDPLEIVFTRGTTEAINLVAFACGAANVGAGDEILIGAGEHASNMMPWQQLAARSGATLRYFQLDDDGRVEVDDFTRLLGARTRVVAFSHVSNVLGIVNPVRRLADLAHEIGAVVLVDAAQSVPHLAVNVQELGCDFLAFSSHKMCGPMGVGVLWARRSLLEAMPPYQFGSNMAHDVRMHDAHFSDGALKFGAGTPNVAGAVGLAAAADFLSSLGRDNTWRHEQRVAARMLERLQSMRGVRLIGSETTSDRVGVFSFTVGGRSPSAVAVALDADGIAVRGGDLASLPLLERLGAPAAVRTSCYLYTTLDEVDRFADSLERIVTSGA